MEIDNYSGLQTALGRHGFIEYLRKMRIYFTNNSPNITASPQIICVGQRHYEMEILLYEVCKDENLQNTLQSRNLIDVCQYDLIAYQCKQKCIIKS